MKSLFSRFVGLGFPFVLLLTTLTPAYAFSALDGVFANLPGSGMGLPLLPGSNPKLKLLEHKIKMAKKRFEGLSDEELRVKCLRYSEGKDGAFLKEIQRNPLAAAKYMDQTVEMLALLGLYMDRLEKAQAAR